MNLREKKLSILFQVMKEESRYVTREDKELILPEKHLCFRKASLSYCLYIINREVVIKNENGIMYHYPIHLFLSDGEKELSFFKKKND